MGAPEQPVTVSVAEAIVQCLVREGTDTVFGIPGGYLTLLLDALCRAGVRSVEARHEAAAAYMAAGYAQASGKIGVVYAQAGPGVLNCLTGFASGFMDSTPMLLLAGQVARADFAGQGHQEASGYDLSPDQLQIFREVCHTAVRPLAGASVPRVTRTALAAARRRRGPAMLDLPTDLLAEEVAFDDRPPSGYRGESTPVDPRDVRAIAALVRKAKRPALLVGNRLTHRGAGATLGELCAEQQIAFATVNHAKGIVAEDHPLCLGSLGRAGLRTAFDYFQSSDLVVVLGARMTHFTTFYNRDLFKNLVQVDEDDREVGRCMPLAYGAVADLPAFVEALHAELAGTRPSREVAQIVAGLRGQHTYYDLAVDESAARQITPPEAMRVLRAHLPREALVVGDTGTTAVSFGRHFPVYAPDSYYALYGLASMGSGMPMAHGVQLARPDALVVSVIGDGAALSHIGELGVASAHGLPVLHVVINNGLYKSIAERQQARFGRAYATKIDNPDYSAVAKAFGCDGYTASTTGALAAAIDAAVKRRRPAVIDVQVDPAHQEEAYADLSAFDAQHLPSRGDRWPFPS